MIVWGGATEAGYFNTGWRYDPVLDSWSSVSTTSAPSPRFYHVAVWSGSRMVIWGGTGSADFNDGGRYDPVTDTWTATSTSGAPVARASATAVWTGTKMIVWGGFIAATGSYANTGGVYDPAANTWTATTTTGAPSGRELHTAVWTGTRMIVWGGRTYSSGYIDLGDGKRYDPVANLWTSVSLTGAPTARDSHTAVWTGSRMVVWGGYNTVNGTDLGDGWRYDPTADACTTVSAVGAPSARSGHTAIWTGNAMIVWGGSGISTELQTGGRYDPTGDAWTTMTTVDAPSARYGHTAVWTGTQMIVSGGEGSAGGVGDFLFPVTGGRYDPAADTWTPTAAGAWAPTARKNHLAFWTGAEMLVSSGDNRLSPYYYFFGMTSAKYDPALDVWTPINAGAQGERLRGVWTGTDMLVFGGDDGAAPTSPDDSNSITQGFRYNLAADSWTPLNSVGMPTGRTGHTAVWSGTEMIVWGGHQHVNGVTTVLADGARYNPATDVWTAMAGTGAPSARENHSAVWTGSQMIVWGGKNGASILADGMRYTPDSAAGSWAPMASPSIAARSGHTAVWTGTRMIVWGGLTGSGRTGDGSSYDPLGDAWTATSSTGAPTARDGHTAVWTPSSDSWAATTLTGAPTPRAAHSAVWADPEMIVWSGNDFGQTPDDSGGRYCTCATRTWYQDLDGDGYGNPAVSILACSAPAGYVADSTDCNDANAAIHPGASDANCNGVDDNCNGLVDEGFAPTSDGWNSTTTTLAPSARTSFVGVSTGSIAIIWGGDIGGSLTNTGARYDPVADSWAATATTTNVPTARKGATAVWTGSQMIVWGGADGAGPTRNGSRYDASTDTWAPMAAFSGSGTSRTLHTAVWTGSQMIVWGGTGLSGDLNSGGIWDQTTNTWTTTAATGSLVGRFNHVAVWTGSKMIVWGGEDSTGAVFGDGAVYDPAANTWSSMTSIEAPSPRTKHTAVWTGSRMIVWGGWNNSGTSYANGASYDPVANTWTVLPSASPLAARRAHSAVWDPADGLMLVWGGTTDSGAFLSDGGRYNPMTSTWSTVSVQNAPAARAGHIGVWLAGAARMFAWGGASSTDLSTGGLYVVTPFSCGVGACLRESGSTCSAGTVGYGCTPGLPAPEVCNGIDDDCDGSIDNGIPAPSGHPSLSESKSGTTSQLSWSAVSGVTGYDVVKGDLGTLRSTSGNFTTSTTSCLGNDLTGTTASDPSVPGPGGGAWHLVRAVNSCGGNGSYDEGVPSQPASRDAGIDAASGACP